MVLVAAAIASISAVMLHHQSQLGQSLNPSMRRGDMTLFPQGSVDLSGRGRLEPLDGLEGTAQGLGELDVATAATARAGDGGLFHLLHGRIKG